MEWLIGVAIIALVGAQLGIPVVLYKLSMKKADALEKHMMTVRNNDLKHIDLKLDAIVIQADRNYKDLNDKIFAIMKDKANK